MATFRDRARARRAIRDRRPPTYRGPQDTRVIVVLVIAVTAFTFAVSDSSQDITREDLQQATTP